MNENPQKGSIKNLQRLRTCLSYDGTGYFGWQKQKGQQPTIQGVLEKSLSKIAGEPIRVVGSGRTDRGVHALRQWAHFDLPENRALKNIAYRLQRMTPDDLRIKTVQWAPKDFHAQISAERKTYLYRIYPQKAPIPFLRNYCWFKGHHDQIDTFRSFTDKLLGKHDFSSFQSTGTDVRSPIREIFQAQWRITKGGFIELHIQGNGFLKQMVRNIVGTVVQMTNDGASPEDFARVLEVRDRQQAAAPAPAQGLYLTQVHYPSELDNKCRKL